MQTECYAVALGKAIRGFAALPIATTIRPTTATTISVFELFVLPRSLLPAGCTLQCQIWQMGYLLGVFRRVQTCSSDALIFMIASENKTESGSLVSAAEELPDSSNLGQCFMVELILQKERKQTRYFTEKLGGAIGLDMILVPAGMFLMGSPEDEPERVEDEDPQHEVTVSSFFMGRYPVTQAQWRFVAGFPQVNRALDLEPSNFTGDNRPVEQTSWYEAVEFCDRLSIHTGRTYRLPSEAEWEYACRAGTTTPFYFGKTLTTELANYDGNYSYNDGPKGEYREKTTPVDQFGIANAFGLCDMHGNVWEWCLDHWHDNYEGAPTDGNAWLSDDETSRRVARGGSWIDLPGYCRSACRDYLTPVFRNYTVGFRVICSAPETL